MPHVLIAPPSPAVGGLLRLLLRHHGAKVTVLDGTEAGAWPGDRLFDLFWLDRAFPRGAEARRIFGAAELLESDFFGGASDRPPAESPQRQIARLLPRRLSLTVAAHRLDRDEWPEFFLACYLLRISGAVTLRQLRTAKSLHFIDGRLCSAAADREIHWLGKRLVADGSITPRQLNEVERALAGTPMKIGRELITRGYLREDRLPEALLEQYRAITLSTFQCEPGEAAFDDRPANPPPHLAIHPFRLLIDGFADCLTAAELDRRLGPLDRCPRRTGFRPFGTEEPDFTAEERRLLDTLDGHTPLARALENGANPEDARRFILALQAARLIASDERIGATSLL